MAQTTGLDTGQNANRTRNTAKDDNKDTVAWRTEHRDEECQGGSNMRPRWRMATENKENKGETEAEAAAGEMASPDAGKGFCMPVGNKVLAVRAHGHRPGFLDIMLAVQDVGQRRVGIRPRPSRHQTARPAGMR